MILQAAEMLVAEEGMEALTVRKVALNIGYTVGSIYMVFTNMNDLIMQVKGRILEQLTEQLNAVDVDDAQSQLRQQVATYFAFASQHYNGWQSVFVSVEDKPMPAWYVEKIDAMLLPLQSSCKRLFPRQSDDQLRLSVRTLLGSVHGLCLLWLNGSFVSQDNETVRRSLDLMVDHFIRE